ncbi:MAG: helix-turn-helix domain-containing protein [Actinomycetota bacterium]
MRPKPAEKSKARRLRREDGMPLKRIAARLGVSLSTVSLWVRDIELDPAHRERNCRQEYAKRATTWSDLNRAKRTAYQQQGRTRAQEGNALHQAGCMLYWAEGAKTRNSVTLANSDPHLLRFFCEFLRKSMGVPPKDFRVSLTVYLTNGLTIEEIENYWLSILDLPRTCLRKHAINFKPTSSSGLKRNRLPYGVCTVRAIGGGRLVQHIFGAIQEYAGFEEPRWLDGPAIKPPRKKRLTATAPN